MEDFNRDAVSIPYFVHEGDMDRMDRTNKRLIVALVLTIVLMFVTNAIWLYEWMQYDYVAEDEYTSTTYEQDGTGTNIMGNHNEVNNGTESNNNEETEDEEENPEIISWE